MQIHPQTQRRNYGVYRRHATVGKEKPQERSFKVGLLFTTCLGTAASRNLTCSRGPAHRSRVCVCWGHPVNIGLCGQSECTSMVRS